MDESSFKCKTCGLVFSGGRTLGQHYTDTPSHRPLGKPRTPRLGRAILEATDARQMRMLSAAELMEATIDKLAIEIQEKRRMLADVEKLKAEITELENQRATIQNMVGAAKNLRDAQPQNDG
jgi:hypothetical protein